MPTNEPQTLDLRKPSFLTEEDLPSVKAQVEAETTDPRSVLTMQSFKEQKQRLGMFRIDWQKETQERLGQRVDRTNGIPLKEFVKYQMVPDRRKVEWLQSAYGSDNVAKDAVGEIIVRRYDPEAKEEVWTRLAGESDSLLYNASRLKWPEMIGGALASGLTGGPRGVIGKLAAKAVGGAVGAAVAGTVSENAAELTEFGEMNRVENAYGQVKKIPLNAAFDFGLGVGGYALSKVFSPMAQTKNFGGRKLAVDLDKATAEVNKIMKDAGMDLRWKSTIGESTQNPELLGIESFWARQPGSQQVFDEVVEGQNEFIKALQKIAIGQNPRAKVIAVPDIESTGVEVIQSIASDVSPAKAAVRNARATASASIKREVGADVASTTGMSTPIPSIDSAGGLLRDTAVVLRNRFKSLSGYEEFKTAFPQFSQQIHPVAGLSARFNSIRQNLPSILKEVEKDTGILDASGNPVVVRELQKKLLSKWSPDGVMSRLGDIADNPNAKVSLDTLKQMRSDLDDDILSGQALPDQGTRYLKQIRKALTDEMDSAVKSWGTKNAEIRWGMINDNYRRNASAYDSPIIQDMFTEPGGGRYVTDRSIAERVISDPKAYDDVVSFFGTKSDQVATLRRSVADRVLKLSESGLSGDVVDAGKLSAEMRRLYGPNGNNRLAREVFGDNGVELANLAEGVDVLRRSAGKSSTELRIGLEDLDGLLSGSTRPTATAIKAAIARQADLDSAFVNSFKKKVADGDVSGIRPQDIVDRILRSPDFSNTEISEVMKVIRKDPSLAGKVKTLAMMDIFNKASFAAKASDNPEAIRRGLFEIDVVGLRKELGLAGERASGDISYQVERVKEIIGDDSYRNLEQLTQLLSPRQAKREISTVGGSMAAGTQRGKATQGSGAERIEYMYDKVHSWLLASAYNNPTIGKLISNQVLTPEKRLILAQGLIAASPTIQNTVSVWGPQWTEWFVESAKDVIDDGVRFLADRAKAQVGTEEITDRWAPGQPTNAPRQNYEIMVPSFAK